MNGFLAFAKSLGLNIGQGGDGKISVNGTPILPDLPSGGLSVINGLPSLQGSNVGDFPAVPNRPVAP